MGYAATHKGVILMAFCTKKNGKYAFHNAYLPHRTYIEMKKLFFFLRDSCFPFLTMQRYKTDFIYPNKKACFFAE